ncbi:MAG: hypothetical protein HYT08_04885 [Candidatus Levybacteria bacterium]|nr:hypothetical protein [Candidatus Levybacteria bacterium]
MLKFFKLTLTISTLFILLVNSSSVFAVTGMPDNTKRPNTPPGLTKKLSSSETGTTASKAGSRKPLLKIRLDQAKLRVCQVKEKIITNRSANMVNHVNRIIAVFDSIVTRITNYYQSRLVPQGRILANFDALILDIQTKKNAITPLLEAAQSDVDNFNCEGDDPKGQLDQFKQDIRAIIPGLKAYKTSVRNLIVAIASIRGAGGGTATGSATPTIEPTVLPTVLPTAVPTL